MAVPGVADARLPGLDGRPRIAVDGGELSEARWFSRDELTAAVADGSLLLPPRVSIARRLVEHWFGAELPGDWSRPLGVPR